MAKETIDIELKGKLASIRRYVQENIWDAPRYFHFTNHNVLLGEQLQGLLLDFSLRLGKNQQLNEVEHFLLEAAALLHDVGMQARTFNQIGIADETKIAPNELCRIIRENCSTLSADMIQNSYTEKPDYPYLGLNDEDYLWALSQICGVMNIASLDALETDLFKLDGQEVNLQLLAHLLLLGKQFFATSQQINIQVLDTWQDMPIDERAWWWLHHYVEQIWIDDKDNIRVQLTIPTRHRDLTERIRELLVKGAYKEAHQQLWDLGIKTSIPDRPGIRYVDHGKEQLPPELEQFIKSPVSVSQDCLLFIDYEGVRIFLGRHGNFNLSISDVIRELIKAAKTYGPLIHVEVYADWERYRIDAQELNELKRKNDYHMLDTAFHIVEGETVSKHMARDAMQAARLGQKQNFILVSSNPDIVEDIQTLQQHGSVIIWAADKDAETAYKPIANSFTPVDNVLKVSLQEKIAWQVEKMILQAIIVILDNDLTRQKRKNLTFGRVMNLLEHPAVGKERHWWVSLAFYHGLLNQSGRLGSNVTLYQIDTTHPLVQEAFNLRTQALETLDTLTQQHDTVTETQLDNTLKTSRVFSNDQGRRRLLTVLKQDKLFKEEVIQEGEELKTNLKVNYDHVIWKKVSGRQHLDRLVVVMDDMLIENSSYRWLSPNKVKQRMRKRLPLKLIQTTFNLADSEGMIRFEQAEDQAGKKYARMHLMRQDQKVQKHLTDRNLIIGICHDWIRLHQNLSLDKLETLLETAAFGEDKAHRLKWIQILVDEGILIKVEDKDVNSLYSLDEANQIAIRALVSHYQYWILYKVKSYHPTDQYPYPGAAWMVSCLTKEVTRSRSLAQATLNHVLDNRWITVRKIEKDESPHMLSILEWTDQSQSEWKKIEQQEGAATERIVDILERESSDGLSTTRMLNLMQPHKEFGLLNAERLLWLRVLSDRDVLETRFDRRRRMRVYSLKY